MTEKYAPTPPYRITPKEPQQPTLEDLRKHTSEVYPGIEHYQSTLETAVDEE